MGTHRFNIYYRVNGKERAVDGLSLESSLILTEVILKLGGEITGIINAEED